jgi:TetR/AcrR family transcriptional regulator
MPHPPAKPRGPGRPNAAAGDPRTELLDAALACFVRRGVAATPLREIANTAGVTPALVNYYFGSKDALVTAILRERLQPALSELIAAIQGDTGGDLLEAFVGGVYRTIERHPWIPALWVREILTEGGALREAITSQVAPQLAPALVQRFRAMQAQGALNPDLDPRLLFVSLLGLTLFPLAARPIWSRVFAADDVGTAQLQRHTLALLRRGLEMKDAQ